MFKPINLVASAARTESTNFAVIANSKALSSLSQIMDDARFYVSVTVVSGTSPTLDINVNAIIDGVNYTLGSFSQATGTTTESITIANCPQDIQLETIITGTTPSFTFEINMTR